VAPETGVRAWSMRGGGIRPWALGACHAVACDKAATIGVGVVAGAAIPPYGAAGAYAEEAQRRGCRPSPMTAVALLPQTWCSVRCRRLLGSANTDASRPGSSHPAFLPDMATSRGVTESMTIASRVG